MAKDNWIAGAVKRPGALHRKLGISKNKKIPAKAEARAAKQPGLLGQEARFAENMKKIRRK